MIEYYDYTKILNSINFIGGAGQAILTPITGDDRTTVDQDDGKTQFYYMILSNLADFNGQGYYPAFETNHLPSNTPALTSEQIYVVQSVLHTALTDVYGVSFEDVANIEFNVGGTTDSHITFGQVNDAGNPGNPAYEYDASAGADSLNHGDVWLNADASISWMQTSEGTYAHTSVLHEVAHSLGLHHTLGIVGLDNQKYSIMSYSLSIGMDALGRDDDVSPWSTPDLESRI